MAMKLPGKTLAVGNVLWFQAGMQRNRGPIKFTAALRERGCLGRWAARDGLSRLERAGLVSIERHRRRAPLVTLLDIPADGDGNE